MSNFVIDSSVAVKWLFLEKGSKQAEQLLQEFTFFLAPDLFLIEFDAVISKKVRKNELGVDEALTKHQQVRKLPYQLVDYSNLSQLAFEISISLPVTLYDATFVAAAVEHDGVLYTADQRLFNGLKDTSLSKYINSIW